MSNMDQESSNAAQLEERILELQTGHWSDAKRAADAAGLTKPEGMKWDDFARTIAIAELDPDVTGLDPVVTSIEVDPIETELIEPELPAETDSVEPVEVQKVESDAPSEPIDLVLNVGIEIAPVVDGEPRFSIAAYKASGVSVCPLCGDKQRVNRHGKPICSIGSADCPAIVAQLL